MKLQFDPEALGLRMSAKVGGLPFQVVVNVRSKRDLLVLDRNRLVARRPGQSWEEFRSWAISDYSELDQQTALEKLAAKISKVAVLAMTEGKFQHVRSFEDWPRFISWLGDVEESIARFTVEFPASLYDSARRLAHKRKLEGGRGTLKEIVIAATEEYVERHSS